MQTSFLGGGAPEFFTIITEFLVLCKGSDNF